MLGLPIPESFQASGLSIVGNIAAAGLSKPRTKRFQGLQLDAGLAKRDVESWRGVQFGSLTNGDVQDWIRSAT